MRLEWYSHFKMVRGQQEFFRHLRSKGTKRERSSALSKRFGCYRQSVGVEECDDGKRHSRIDFHSWRRWFVTEARRAGINRAVVAAVVGHRIGSLTDDIYADRPDAALLSSTLAIRQLGKVRMQCRCAGLAGVSVCWRRGQR